MRTGKLIIGLLASGVVAALVLAVTSALAGSPGQGSEATGLALTGTVASKISYQGRLTDAAGNPLNGSYNLVFQLWDDATAGSQVGGDIVRNNVPVSNGLFTVDLDVPQDAFNGQALWLRIQVGGQWLSPRQELLPVPYALSLRPGAWINGNSTDAAITVTNAGLVGTAIKVNGAGVGLDVLGATGIYVQGWGLGIDAYGMTGVRGQGDVGVQGLGLIGVRGTSETGYGVMGVTNAPMTATAAAGVYGESFSGHGVEGRSQFDVGVYGQSSGGFGAGVGGVGVTGVFGQGGLVGVSGYTTNDNTTGVLGTATGVSAKGVEGIANNYGSIGVYGSGGFGIGVQGNGETGVKGVSSVGAGVWGEGATGVYGTSQSGAGVYATSSTGDGVQGYGAVSGVYGEASNYGGQGILGVGKGANAEGVVGSAEGSTGIGVYGMAAGSGDGVRGLNSATGDGVHGIATASNKSGVYGESTAGFGVTGRSTNNTGVQGFGYTGVYGKSSTDYGQGVHGHGTAYLTEGVIGTADGRDGAGVYARANGSGGLATGVEAESTSSYAVYGDTFVSGGYGFYTPDKIYAGGGCVGCTSMLIARNGGEETLEPGDVVVVAGIAAPLSAQGTRPVIVVRKADAASEQAVVGVVEGRYTFELVSGNGRVVEWAQPTEEPAAPGEYLTVVYRGLARVKVDARNGAIKIGDPLTVASASYAVPARAADAAPGNVIGKAMEALATGQGLIWVLVDMQ